MKTFNKKLLFIFLIIIILFSCVLAGDSKNQKSDAEEDYTDYYRLFNPNNFHEIEIQITQSEFDNMVNDMIAHDAKYPVTWHPSLNNYRVNKYYKANFIYKGVLGDVRIDDIGFRTKGNFYTRHLPYNPDTDKFQRTHFRLKFNKTFNMPEHTAEYKIRKKRKFACVKELNLKWSINSEGWNKDNTQIREMYVNNLFNRAGIHTAKASKTKFYLTIDGVKHDYGVYSVYEHIDKDFLTKRFGKDGNDGNLYKCLSQDGGPATLSLESISKSWAIGLKDWSINKVPSYDRKTNKDDLNYADIIKFVININTKEGDDFVNYIDKNFDVDYFLKAIALNNLVGNCDDYWGNGHNYYLYFHNKGKIIYIPYDLDQSLAGKSWDGNHGSTQIEGWEHIANADIYDGFQVMKSDPVDNQRPLIKKILSIPKYQEKYESYFEELINPDNDLFDYEDFEQKYNSYYALFGSYVDNDIMIGETMTLTSGDSELMEIEDYYNLKIQSIKNQLGL